MAPWLKKFYYEGTDTFVVPLGGGFVTLGTCKQYESWNPEISQHDTASIKERCAKLVPSTARAKESCIWVGLRPHRHILRLETERLSNLKVVTKKWIYNFFIEHVLWPLVDFCTHYTCTYIFVEGLNFIGHVVENIIIGDRIVSKLIFNNIILVKCFVLQ